MHDMSAVYKESPSRSMLKRNEACSPAHGSPHSPDLKRPNLQSSPSSSTRSTRLQQKSPTSSGVSTKRRWSKQEDEKLCAAVKGVGLNDWKTIAEVYMKGHGLSDAQCMHRWQKVLRPGLVKGSFCEKEDKIMVDCLREGGLKRRWTKQEDEKLCNAVKQVGTHDWKQIAEIHLAGHGRSDVQCCHRWQKVLRAGLVKGAFTEDEDRIIIDCMREGGLTWMQIAERIPGRIGKQCRERWTNHLDPNLKKGGWTHEEDTILAEAQQRWGNAWTKIAKLLPGRAENAVKNRWNSAFRRKKSAMFGKAPADEDTAAIARARLAMDTIDRDEREPAGSDASSTKSRNGGSSSSKRERPSFSDHSDIAAPIHPHPAKDVYAIRGVGDAGHSTQATILRLSCGSSHDGFERPASENEVLDLFDEFGQNADIDDSLLSLDGVDDDVHNRASHQQHRSHHHQQHHHHRGIAECDLDVSFDALDVTGVDPVDLTQSVANMSDLGDCGAPAPALSRSPLSNCPEDDLFYHGRTGLTPSGPLQKTPSGMVSGLLSPHDLASGSGGFQGFPSETSSVTSSVLPSQADDLTIDLPAVDSVDHHMRSLQAFPADRAARIAHCEFISPNVQEYHAAWGLPAPEVKIPTKVSQMLNTAKQPFYRNVSAVSDDTVVVPDKLCHIISPTTILQASDT